MKVTTKQFAQTLFDLTVGQSKPEIEKSTADFARYIYRNRKLKMADKIIGQFADIYNKKKGIIEAEVVTVEIFSASTEKKVKGYVEKKYNAKEVILKNTVDENVKGGIILKIGDEIIDGSVAGQLRELKKILS